jgi:hypothetical protein
LWHEIDWSPGLSIHTVVTREASCGEQGGACTRKGDRDEVSAKKTSWKKGGTPAEAKGTVNNIRLSLAGVLEAWLSFAGWTMPSELEPPATANSWRVVVAALVRAKRDCTLGGYRLTLLTALMA